MGPIVDPTSELGAKVTRRVEGQTLAWLTTVAADGTPQPNPVRFETQYVGPVPS